MARHLMRSSSVILFQLYCLFLLQFIVLCFNKFTKYRLSPASVCHWDSCSYHFERPKSSVTFTLTCKGPAAEALGLWGLVNNAGVSAFGEVEFASLDDYKNVAEINLWGTVRVTKAFLPLIRRAKGRVVNITSMLGRMASPSRSCYCVSKFGVAAFSDCLRQEMYRWGVRVILIEPSNFVAATGILTADGIDKQAEALWNGASDVVREDYGREYFTHHVAMMKSFVNSGLKDMSLVLDDITDALTSMHPKNRYNPMETYWWVRLQVMTHLPTAIADWLYVPGATL
ncbi:D-beta-hydroxybutyrate dehydrogenase, mitochondrial-like isoform X2 [Phaenicophaeus curvirostris]|uniref:D-beta-hydroxybutyrate dehydrogenase, mitochondrial-like isoform X2 n=1 Tax=Phaenicophaeus curvirostris TaxID=33595 RepID=UPI0037F0FFBF